jgi:hypothetical protein
MEIEFVLTSFGLNLIVFYGVISYVEDRLSRINQLIGELKMADNIIHNNYIILEKKIKNIKKNNSDSWVLESEESEEIEESEESEESEEQTD